MMPHPDDVALCSFWADQYRRLGFNVLPSSMTEKKPLVKFVEKYGWDKPFPKEEFDKCRTTNLQVVLGCPWHLIVIDLDGRPARTWWESRAGSLPRTWITHSSGGGWHLWFVLPDDFSGPLSKAVLWRGDGPHEAVERLCDRSLIMAPPSIHPKTGERYRFLPGHSPREVSKPLGCPRWVLDARPVDPPREAVPMPVRRNHGSTLAPASGERYDLQLVLDAIPDKVAVAKEWGIRVAGKPSHTGWVPCHALDREDVHPSAAIHRESGGYVDQGSGLRLPFFKLAVHLGAYPDVPTAITHLGDRYANRTRRRAI